eukprot:gnl/TRDRNA2_/TRDRNA2_86203_c0_seq2.p1 gnl/TRDRNA2_/TRDRNA2_86203_c0~~gnl/TRDRNA2_/TRDRNA2_86203_c0_seq2.p1  ORF type:complete len:163 (-),score=15.34 gnl/TRDRNA2_/TRDRNA2_86203_c0_seq2:214-702(-)
MPVEDLRVHTPRQGGFRPSRSQGIVEDGFYSTFESEATDLMRRTWMSRTPQEPFATATGWTGRAGISSFKHNVHKPMGFAVSMTTPSTAFEAAPRELTALSAQVSRLATPRTPRTPRGPLSVPMTLDSGRRTYGSASQAGSGNVISSFGFHGFSYPPVTGGL